MNLMKKCYYASRATFQANISLNIQYSKLFAIITTAEKRLSARIRRLEFNTVRKRKEPATAGFDRGQLLQIQAIVLKSEMRQRNVISAAVN